MHQLDTFVTMNYTLCLCFICLISLLVIDGFGQKKRKKNPYVDYWEQQEKQEQFDKIAKQGHELFQAKDYEAAKNKYEEALTIIPTDQRTIAKVRDINLLIEKQKIQREKAATSIKYTMQPVVESPITKDTTTANVEVPDTLTLYLNEERLVETPKGDTTKPIVLKKEEITKIETDPFQKKTAEPKQIVKKPIKKEPEEKMNAQPYKNSENYRKYLATIHKAGWTEEQYKEGKKEITKRVYVKEKHGDEYLMVKHHYGAVYYFKNGESISYMTWVAETEKSAN